MRSGFLLTLAALLRVDGATLRTVCASDCQYALNQIQQALDDAACGDVIQVQGGQNATTGGGLVLRNKGCPSGVYTSIRTSALDQLTPNKRIQPAMDASKMARLTSGSGLVISIDQAASYYRFEGIELAINPGQDPFTMIALFTVITGGVVGETQISQLANHIEFDRCWIHGTVQSHGVFSRCVGANSGELVISNSVVNDCFNPQSEAQAVAGWNAAGPFYFRNTQFSASQIGTLFGGAPPSIPGIRATGLFYQGNYYYRPWTWRGTSGNADPSGACLFDSNGGEMYVNTSTNHCFRCSSGTWSDQGAVSCPMATLDKNHFELKNAWGAFVEGNVIQNGWQPALANQKGAAILFNQVDFFEPPDVVAYVTIQNNRSLNTPWVVNTGLSGNFFDYPMHDITLENNLFTNVGGEPQSQNDATLIQTTATGRFRYSHNTFLFGRDKQAYGGRSVQMDAPTDYVEFYGNILQYGGNTVGLTGGFFGFGGAGGLESAIQRSWSIGSSVSKDVVVNNNGCMTSTDASALPCPVRNIQYPDSNGRIACPSCGIPRYNDNGGTNDVGFVDFNSGDYHLASTSPFKNWTEMGRDAGADIDKVNWATAGAVTGMFNPYLDFRISGIIPAQTTAQIFMNAPTTESCTTTVAANWLYTNPVFTNTDGGGDVDRGVGVTGLAPDTRYWVKVVCGAAHYQRDDVFYTRRGNTVNIQVIVTPGSASALSGQQVQFSANVYGSTNNAVNWSVQPALGSINASGTYTPPISIGAVQTVTVIATASADGTSQGTATVALLPPPAGTVTFMGVDATTQGNWITVYGTDGYVVIGNATSLPAYATVTPSGKTNYTWAASTGDVRALQYGSGNGRVAAQWYSDSSFLVDFQLGPATHTVAIYCLDWDMNGRTETLEFLDGTTNADLDTRNVASFAGGKYLIWQLSGHVKLRVTNTAGGGTNGTISGIFFGPN